MTPFRPFALALFAFTLSLPAGAAEVMRDDFSDPKSGWSNFAATRDSDLGFAVYTDTGGYQMTPVADDTFGFIVAPKQAATGKVRIEADLFLYAGIGAGAAGVGCRYKDHKNFYAFMARGDAQLMILKIKDGVVTPLAQGAVKSIMPGSVDTRLVAECHGSKLTLAAKGGAKLTATDADFAEGKAGLFVIGEKMAGTSAAFDNFVLAE